jgi:16S rRNA (cytosine967-C5)-methyltransferase
VINGTNTREIVLDLLVEVLEKGAFSHIVLRQALDKYGYLPRQDRAFITRMTEGTIEYLPRLDYAIDRVSKVKKTKMKPVVRTLLRMSAYQILFMERVPDSAVVNEAVKLAKKRGFLGLSGFVNGVLRTLSREKGKLSFDTPELCYALPQWIFSMWERDYGRETAEETAKALLSENRRDGLTVRFNLSKASAGTICKSLEKQGITVHVLDGGNGAVYQISGYDSLEQTEAFQKGFFVVQDLSSYLVGAVASPKKGDFVLDLCSAPGGKALHIADLLGGTGLVEARDLTEAKVALIEENAARCGFSNIRARAWDASVFDGTLEGKADIVLADLPCSGLGILGRKPDIKLRLREEDLSVLAELQRKFLSVACRYLKPGGLLLYSTCTVEKMENEENAVWAKEALPLEAVPLSLRVPGKFRKDCEGNQLLILPGRHGCDGFFIAAFCKKPA